MTILRGEDPETEDSRTRLQKDGGFWLLGSCLATAIWLLFLLLR